MGYRMTVAPIGRIRRSASFRPVARPDLSPVPLQERALRHPDLPDLGPTALGKPPAARGVVPGEQETLPPRQPPPGEPGERPVLEPREPGFLPEEAGAPDGLNRLVLGARPEIARQRGQRAKDLAPVAEPSFMSF